VVAIFLAALKVPHGSHIGICAGLLGFGLFDERFLADDDDDAGGSDMEAAAVGFEVETNFSFFGEADVAVDDGAAYAGVAADVDVVVEDGIGDFAIAIHADIVTDDAILDLATGEDGAAGDDGVNSDAHAVGIGENEFGRGILVLPTA